jgi:PAS domain S-box-containing protein
MLGYPKQELVKLSWADITHPDDLTADEAQFTRVLAGEIDTYELEKRYIRKNGEVIYTQMSAGCVRNPDHSVDYFVALLQNITNRKLIENALRESEEKYRNLYESMKDSVITTDLEGNILDCNQVCLDMLGYTMEEMKNLTYQQFTPAKWHAFEDQILKTQITSRGYSDEYEKEYIRKDGSEIPISVRSWLIKDQDGHPSRLWSIIRDITTRKSAEQELQSKSSLLEAQLNATTEGILVIDKQNIRLLINQRFIDLLNIPAHLLAEKEDSMLLNYVVGLTENPQLFLEKVMYLNSHPDEKSYDEVVFKSGIIVERYSAPILSKDGKNDGRIWTFRDITSRKLTEQQIKLKNEELHKLNAERDKFYSIIAHDLRGPIGAIMGLSEMMADESQYFSEQERKDLTMEISHSSSNVFNLLEQLLEWSKSEQGLTDFNPQTLVLNDLVTKSAKIVGEQARLKSVDLIVKIPTDLEVFADQNMLQTILRNLISNAIKYTRQGGKVVVTGQAGEDMSTLISVKDSGIGMGKKILENLFRMDVDTKRPGTNGEHSTGLGILLCKEFIEKHGGTFSVESEEGKGSVFSFTIPYHEPIIGVTSVPVSIPEVIKNNTLNSLKILIAEDDEISAKLLRAMIKGFCKEILIVTNGTDAVKTIRNNPDINLILLDISMPELDGYEVTKQIRQFNTKVVIIAQTALALKSDIERALTAGCDDHISKPIKSNVLKLLILKYFEN